MEFICACNPYKLKNSNKNENIQNLQNNLEYDVKPLPPSLNNFIFDFGALSENDEEQYIFNYIELLIHNRKSVLECIKKIKNEQKL